MNKHTHLKFLILFAAGFFVLSAWLFITPKNLALSQDYNNSAKEPSLAKITRRPVLEWPVDCQNGHNCWVYNYVDMGPHDNMKSDFFCGQRTYDGHKGTDFAIPDEKIMAKGVAVEAVAAGKVLRVRDGIPDRRVKNQADKDKTKNIECGNGMVIDHGNGWETQYLSLIHISEPTRR